VATTLARRPRQIAVDVEERCTRNVPREVELPSARRVGDVPAAVDELVARYQLPSGDGGKGTDAGWIT
jgi:hypothetical protein